MYSQDPGRRISFVIPELRHLYRSPNYRAYLYSAACALHPGEIEEGTAPDGETLLRCLRPQELAAFTAVLYLYRKLEKLMEERAWAKLSGEVRAQVEVGVRLGSLLPEIGTARAITVGAIRYLTLGLFSLRDIRNYREYLRIIKGSNLLWERDEELRLFGCTHLQIASIILQEFGFGLNAAEAIGIGLEPLRSRRPLEDEGLKWLAAGRWIESLLVAEKRPRELTDPRFVPTEENYKNLQSEVEEIVTEGKGAEWLQMRAENVEPEIVKKLAALPLELTGDEEEAEDEELTPDVL